MCQEASINKKKNVNDSNGFAPLTDTPTSTASGIVELNVLKVDHMSHNNDERILLEDEKIGLKIAVDALKKSSSDDNVKKVCEKLEQYCNIIQTEALALDYKPSKENLSEEEYRKQYRKRYKSGSAAIRKELQNEAEYLNEIKKMLIELKKDDTLENIRTDVEACFIKVKKIRGELSIERTKPKKNEQWKLDKDIKDEMEWEDGEAYDFRKLSCKNSKEKIGKIFYKGSFMWDRRKEPLFAHKPNIEDIQQGQIGDCYLLSTLAAIAKQEPDSIQKNMLDNEDGTVTVRFFDKDNFYKPVYITVSKKVPRISASGALWVQVMEKAMAAFITYKVEKEKAKNKRKTDMDKIWRAKKKSKVILKTHEHAINMIDYGTIGKGGKPGEAAAVLLGREGSEIKINDIPTDLKKVCDIALELANEKVSKEFNERIKNKDYRTSDLKYNWKIEEDIKKEIDSIIPYNLKDSFREPLKELKQLKVLFGEFVNLCEKNMPNIKDSNGVYSKSEIKSLFGKWANKNNETELIEYIEKQKKFWNSCKKKFGIEKEKDKEDILKKIILKMFIPYFERIKDYVNDASIGIYNEMSGDYSEYATDLFMKIEDAISNNKIISAGSKKIKKKKNGIIGVKKKDGVVGAHAYSVLETEILEDLYFIKLRNPWGEYGMKYTIEDKKLFAKKYKHARDGQFWIELNHFIKLFDEVEINEAREQNA